MEPRAGRDVYVEVGMVHAMEPPKRGDGVEGHVLEIDREIEQGDRERHGHPRLTARRH